MAAGTVPDDRTEHERVLLKLYVAGHTERSRRARRDLEAICRAHDLAFDIEVIDIVERPELAEHERILATPVVVRELPPPMRRIIGDLTDIERVLVGLELHDGGSGE